MLGRILGVWDVDGIPIIYFLLGLRFTEAKGRELSIIGVLRNRYIIDRRIKELRGQIL